MLNLVSIRESLLACCAGYPADNLARQLALFYTLRYPQANNRTR